MHKTFNTTKSISHYIFDVNTLDASKQVALAVNGDKNNCMFMSR